MDTVAVVLSDPERLALSRVVLNAPQETDVVVDVSYSGISTGTERLLWSGRMPTFPGMGYPLVPGYESIGRVVEAGARATHLVGAHVFVPGSNGFKDVRGLFGGAASTLVVSSEKIVPVDEALGERGVLLALAATAYHAIRTPGANRPDLIVGHGVLGRLVARLALVDGEAPPVVWEINAGRAEPAVGYDVVHPDQDQRRDYRCIVDVSGDSTILDRLIARLAPGGEIVLAGFYEKPLSFSFPPAFMREARLRVAAEWKRADLAAVNALINAGRLSLNGLVTHRADAHAAEGAYRTAFEDPTCLKMVLDWRSCA